MDNLGTLGAINKLTRTCESPYFAIKTNQYECPECEQDVTLRKGTINKPHFSHRNKNNKCTYYDKPVETPMHKKAKLKLKNLLENNDCVILKSCVNCDSCESINIPSYDENTEIILEYMFKYDNTNKYADLAYIDKNTKEIKAIFEIYFTHRTNESSRPEPWYEIKAQELLDEEKRIIVENNDGEEDNNIYLSCNRKQICQECKDSFVIFEDGNYNYEKVIKSLFLEKDVNKAFLDWINLYGFFFHGKYIKFNCFYENKKLIFNYNKSVYNNEIYDNYLNDFTDKFNNTDECSKKLRIFTQEKKPLLFNFTSANEIIERNYFNFIEKIKIKKNSINIYPNNEYYNIKKNEKIKLMDDIKSFFLITFNETKCIFKKKYDDFSSGPIRIYFDVEYKNKEEIKKLNGKWDEEKKKWYIEDNFYNEKNIAKAHILFEKKNTNILFEKKQKPILLGQNILDT